MDYNKAFPSKYLKAADLGTSAPLATIERVAMEVVGGKDTRPVAYFRGKDKGVVLNKTNAKTIAQIAGSPEMDDWAGTTIQLFAASVEFQGELMDAIRVRQPRQQQRVPAPKPAPPPPEPDDDDLDAITDNDIPF